LADGVYLGGILGPVPTQSLAFTPTGVTITDKNGNKIDMKAGSIDITTTSLRVNGSVIAGFGTGDQVGLQTHTHSGVATGGSVSGVPVPGT
jgi:hypothetical protein